MESQIDSLPDRVHSFPMDECFPKPLVHLPIPSQYIRGDRIEEVKALVAHLKPGLVDADVNGYYISFSKSPSHEHIAKTCIDFLKNKPLHGTKLYPRLICGNLGPWEKKRGYKRPAAHQVVDTEIRKSLVNQSYIYLPLGEIGNSVPPAIEVVDRIHQLINCDPNFLRAVKADPTGYYIVFGAPKVPEKPNIMLKNNAQTGSDKQAGNTTDQPTTKPKGVKTAAKECYWRCFNKIPDLGMLGWDSCNTRLFLHGREVFDEEEYGSDEDLDEKELIRRPK